ncbi:uncharacterized protein [Glycine max]|uniref:uncharacterized protein n=2 Tax=Glycine subgen. Soja TaxID=1462606 RepID=UPI001B35527C|nr:uncharacterized protein LOC100782437 [Glycine max]
MVDSSQLLEAASDFAHYTGAHSDDSARDFLNRFPLPVIFSALQTQFDVPGLENTLVTCLERLFNTKLGASLIPQYMPFVQVGLQADSQAVRSLACKTVTCLIENLDNDHKVAASVRLIKDFNMYPLLLDCFIKGNNQHKNTEKGVEGRSLEYKEPWDLRDYLRSIVGPPRHLLVTFQAHSPEHEMLLLKDKDQQGMAALHALGNISGKTRSENSIILNAEAEVNLRRLIYETASRSTKLTPSGLFLSVLQQDSEMRLAGYRMLSELVARPWCLMEICSKQEIINKVTDPSTETTKIGMEGRYDCCKAIHKSLTVSSRVSANPAFAGIAAKLQEAVEMGPYLIKRHVEAQPAVMTADRF